MARIPDGIQQTLGNTVRFLVESGRSMQELETLRSALQRAASEKTSEKEIRRTIETHAPELTSIGATLPKTRLELYTLLIMLCAVIALLKPLAQTEKAPKTDAEIQAVVDRAIKEQVGTPKNRAERRAHGRPRRPAPHK